MKLGDEICLPVTCRNNRNYTTTGVRDESLTPVAHCREVPWKPWLIAALIDQRSRKYLAFADFLHGYLLHITTGVYDH